MPRVYLFVIFFITIILSADGSLLNGGADLLDATKIREVPLGIEQTTGICDNRVQNVLNEESVVAASISDPNSIRGTFNNRTTDLQIQVAPDIAYSISLRAVLSVNTGQLFPDGFPTDFAIVGTFKPVPDSRSVLFSIYNDAGDEHLAVEIDDRIHLLYQDSEGQSGELRVTFDQTINDGRWHQMGLAVKGNSATLVLDCQVTDTLELNRTEYSRPSNTGIVLIGQRLLDDAFFTGSIQQLLIIPNPDPAFEVCSTFMPECDRPIPSLLDVSQDFARSQLIFGGEEAYRNSSAGQNNNNNNADSYYLDVTASGSSNLQILRGPPGPRGYTGLQGLQGPKGDKGEAGRDGLLGTTGIQGPPGHIFMIPLSGDGGGGSGSGSKKGPDATAESLRQMLAQHMMAMQGPAGPMGLTGVPGSIGNPGVEGQKGEMGEMGEPGPRGHRGEMGASGRSGRRGRPGRDGERGMTGPPGEKGEQGVIGLPGLPGEKGDRGEKGGNGEKGMPGHDGPQGDDGAPGLIGQTGEMGPRGFIGPRGFQGLQGL